MSAEQNKALHQRLFEETFVKHNVAIADEILDPDYVNYDFPAPAPGREGWKLVATMFLSAFPDMQPVVEDIISEGNKVATRGCYTGTTAASLWASQPRASQSASSTSTSGQSRMASSKRTGCRWI